MADLTGLAGGTLTALVAFAANSVLCRAALDAGAPDAAAWLGLFHLVAGSDPLSILFERTTP